MNEPGDNISLHLHVGDARRGQPLTVSVEFRHNGTRPCSAVGVLDGSEMGLRYPRYRPEITRDGVVVASPGVPEDPLVGPLRAADFVHLGPGEAFDPTAKRGAANFLPLITFTTFSPAEAGLYVCTLEYSSESPTPEDWLGRFNQDDERDAVLKLLADVPRVTVQAEPLHAVVQ